MMESDAFFGLRGRRGLSVAMRWLIGIILSLAFIIIGFAVWKAVRSILQP